VIRAWPHPETFFGVDTLVPAGVFYVNLRGKHPREPNRTAALLAPDAARKRAYQHAGRFDVNALPYLDNRPDTTEGDQFKFRLTQTGEVHKGSREAMESAKFQTLLNRVEGIVQEMGRDIFAGKVAVAPYRKGIVVACDQCTYQSICRIDPWTHSYRTLRKTEEAD
jgi:ATP-dependent helicase/nuclease subunit B